MHSESVNEPYTKNATTPQAVARLRHEFQILRRVHQPGIVEIIGYRGGPRAAQLLLAPVDGKTFTKMSFKPRNLAVTVSAIAATVAYLHDQNIAHGRLNGDHVLISRHDSRPVLCGFGDATEFSPEDVATRAADVRALGQLLNSKLSNVVVDLRDRLAREEDGATDGGHDAASNLERRLRDLVMITTVDDDDRIPTARALAGQLRAAVQLADVHQRNREPRRDAKRIGTLIERVRTVGVRLPVPHPSMVIAAKGLASVAAVLVVFSIVWHVVGTDDVARTPPAKACPTRAAAPLVFDVDRDGCGDAVTLGDGTIQVNDDQFTVGQAGDLLAIGRWQCDDARTVALLRPGSGDVFVFDNWPQVGKDTVPRLVGNVPEAAAISAQSDGACDQIAVTSTKGTKVFSGAMPTATSSTPATSTP